MPTDQTITITVKVSTDSEQLTRQVERQLREAVTGHLIDLSSRLDFSYLTPSSKTTNARIKSQ